MPRDNSNFHAKASFHLQRGQNALALFLEHLFAGHIRERPDACQSRELFGTVVAELERHFVRCHPGNLDGAGSIRISEGRDIPGKKRQYGYYLCNEDTKRNIKTCPTPRIPAAEFEALVLRELAVVLNTPTMLAKIDRRLEADDDMSVRQEMTARAVAKLEQLWEVMVSTERYALIHRIVSRIVVFKDRLKVEFNRDGMVKLLQEAGLEAAHE